MENHITRDEQANQGSKVSAKEHLELEINAICTAWSSTQTKENAHTRRGHTPAVGQDGEKGTRSGNLQTRGKCVANALIHLTTRNDVVSRWMT